MPGPPEEVDWTAVIARTLAFLCVRQAQMEGETLLEQANFLERFGIPLREAAEILGSNERSLKEMERQKMNRKKTNARKAPGRKRTGPTAAPRRRTRG